jgi:tetratricopeptide (TPR) repeat protein
MTMDGRISVALLSFALTMGCAGCVTTQSQKPADNGPIKTDETPVITKNDGPKRNPQAKTEIAFGKLKEMDAESDMAKSDPELQARLRDEARRAFQKALEIDKNNLEAARCLAGVYVKSGAYDRAFEIYKKAIEKHPKDSSLWYELALAHQRRKDFPESVRCLTKALEMDPENRDYMKKLGFTLAWMGQIDQGFDYLMRAQGKALAHCNIARVLIERNQPQLARQHIMIARQESPDLAEANALLVWLDKTPGAAAVQ